MTRLTHAAYLAIAAATTLTFLFAAPAAAASTPDPTTLSHSLHAELESVTVTDLDASLAPVSSPTTTAIHQPLTASPTTVTPPTNFAVGEKGGACRTAEAVVRSYDYIAAFNITHTNYRYHYRKTWCVHGLPPTHYYADADSWFSDVDPTYIPYAHGWQVGGLARRGWFCQAWKDNTPGDDRCMVHMGYRSDRAYYVAYGKTLVIEEPVAGVQSGIGLDYALTAYLINVPVSSK